MGKNRPDFTDEITDTVTEGSVYERLRLERTSIIAGSVPRKIAVQSFLLFVLACCLPITAAFPAPAQALFPAGDPTTASPQVILLGLIGLVVLSVTGLVLAGLEYVRLRFESRFTEAQFHTLLNCEDLASLFGIGTGGLTVLITDGFFLLGFADRGLLETYARQAPNSAFVDSGTGISVVALAVGAFCGAVVLFTVSRHLGLLGDLRKT